MPSIALKEQQSLETHAPCASNGYAWQSVRCAADQSTPVLPTPCGQEGFNLRCAINKLIRPDHIPTESSAQSSRLPFRYCEVVVICFVPNQSLHCVFLSLSQSIAPLSSAEAPCCKRSCHYATGASLPVPGVQADKVVSELVRASRRHLFLSISLKPHTKVTALTSPALRRPAVAYRACTASLLSGFSWACSRGPSWSPPPDVQAGAHVCYALYCAVLCCAATVASGCSILNDDLLLVALPELL